MALQLTSLNFSGLMWENLSSDLLIMDRQFFKNSFDLPSFGIQVITFLLVDIHN
jgi:hypothetical protein